MREKKARQLNARLSARTLFALEYSCRELQITQTAGIERAIELLTAYAEEKCSVNFEEIWHPDPAIRYFRIITSGAFKLTTEEEEARWFIKEHSRYFYYDYEGFRENSRAVKVLMKKMPEILKKWRSGDDYEVDGAQAAVEALLHEHKVEFLALAPEEV